ncbi:DUF4177 domain-containing protein [Roseibacterium sp. SDUM158016]|uniref:DUF4177 domain-containing protein n=1 Tax=Roseicyclus sediminis TaxID=2980997 RepID=UPI0021CDFD10|nr:DUF4177 domain-containing protein [Roseibacterium sp. SDUM158016]MCU4653834.1 DUF4177 domain-containing protein [Roseibacterium sp. SDUM158016]
MPFYEYKVVPAPERAPKVKGLKGAPKFAHALETTMNELAQDGWEYLRAESLPDEEKKGLMGGKEIVTRNVLIFRRELYFEEPAAEETPKAAPMTLSRSARAEEAAEADAEADIESIYAGAEEPEATRPERPPLVADRKGQGVDL